MTKCYDFKNGTDALSDFFYVYSPICREFKTFTAENDHVRNLLTESGFEYISVQSKEKYGSGVEVSTVCSFDSYGAPLIVITDDIKEEAKGLKRYGLHFEIVAYENGINVWHILPFPQRTEKPIEPTKIAFSRFPIKAGSKIEMSVKIEGKKFIINVNGNMLEVENNDIPATFHVGFTACEGVNRFNNFTISV